MKLDEALDDVQRGENELARQLRLLGEHHAADHDIYHLGHTLSLQCVQRVERLAPFLARYDARPIPTDGADGTGLVDTARRRASQLLGRAEASGMWLLHDLRDVYLQAHRTEISWVILNQAAEAARDADLLAVVSDCSAQAETTIKWLRTRIKVSAPQVLVTG